MANLAALLKMGIAENAEFDLAVNAPDPDASVRAAFAQSIVGRMRAGRPTAVADLSFLTLDYARERELYDALEQAGVAGLPIAYASWNTTANSAGTALAEAAATLIGRRFGTFDPSAAATFLFERYVDDYAYRVTIREPLQTRLRETGVDVYALGAKADDAESMVRAELWPAAIDIFERDFKERGYRADAIEIHLPWQRTFEVRLDASIRPAAPE